MIVNVSEAKAQLSSLLDRVYHGETVTIAKNNLPIADLVKHQPRGKRRLGLLRGQIVVPDDFTDEDPAINELFCLIENPANAVFVSAVSIAEIAIKSRSASCTSTWTCFPRSRRQASSGSTSAHGRRSSWPSCRSTTGIRSTACWLSRAGPTISSW